MRRGRDGDLLDDDDDASVERLPHEHACVDGWIGTDDDGRPVPCPACKPHLQRCIGLPGRPCGQLVREQPRCQQCRSEAVWMRSAG
jgi:hypothetical protein